MALRAGLFDQIGVVQRADEVVAAVLRPVLGHRVGHVAVGAGEVVRVLAARAEEGLELGVLHLDLFDAGARVGPVGEGLAVGEVGRVVEEGQHLIGRHARETVVGDRGRLGVGGEVIFVVALAAGEVRARDAVKVLAERVDPVGVGDDDLLGRVGVAVVAADGLGDLGLNVRPALLVGGNALLVHHDGEIRGLAGPAIGERMGPSGGFDVLHVVVVAAGAAVVDGKAVALVERAEHGIDLKVVVDVVALAGHQPGVVLVGVLLGPVRGMHDRDAGIGHNPGGHLDRRRGGNIFSAEAVRGQAAALHGVENGRLDGVGTERRARDGVDLKALRIVDHAGELVDGDAADPVGLGMGDDVDLVDLVLVGDDLDLDGAVAARGRAAQMLGGGGDVPRAGADGGGPRLQNGKADGDDQHEHAAGEPDDVGHLSLFHGHFSHSRSPHVRRAASGGANDKRGRIYSQISGAAEHTFTHL